MIGMVDYHMHTVLSDGKNSFKEMVLMAISKGLDEIGFSDHVCLKPVDWAIRMEDIPVMTGQIHDLQEKYKDQIQIRYGIEVDYFPGYEDELRDLIESIPVDMLLVMFILSMTGTLIQISHCTANGRTISSIKCIVDWCSKLLNQVCLIQLDTSTS